MSASAANNYAFNQCLTIAAGFSLAGIDIEMVLMAALATFPILIVAEGRAAIFDACGNHLIDTFPKPLAFSC